MSSIAIVMLPEEGHLTPTFKLAKSLQRRGHRLCYLVNHDYADYVCAQRLECIAFAKEFWQPPTDAPLTMPAGIERMNEIIWANRDALVKLIKEINPALLVVDAYLPAVALSAWTSGVPVVFLNVAFDINTPASLLNTLQPLTADGGRTFRSLLKVPQLITYPREFEFKHMLTDERALYYIEASLDLHRSETPFDWSRLDETKPLIYCTLGSQCHLFKASRQFFQTVIDALRERPQWQMLLSVGKHLSADFADVPANVLVVNWAPQLEVLKRASVMITHGGIGTLKDCIYFGVPMIVFPMMRDQPMSGARVVYHGLGVRGDLRNVTVAQVHALIDEIEQNKSYRERVQQMSLKFRAQEESGKGVKIIEKLLAVLARKSAHTEDVKVH